LKIKVTFVLLFGGFCKVCQIQVHSYSHTFNFKWRIKIMSLVTEFKEFVSRGNVVDLAVGVVIGAAFGKIVSSLVADVMMPLIGIISGAVDVSNLSVGVADAQIKYGQFLQTVIDFIIVAFAVFMMVKAVNAIQRKKETEPAAPPAPTKSEILLSDIRDLLKASR
jgi:large conductance mechanosensitive channel